MGYLKKAVGAATFFSIYQTLVKQSGLNWWMSSFFLNGTAFLVSGVVAYVMYLLDPHVSLNEYLFRPDAQKETARLMLAGVMFVVIGGAEQGIGHTFYHQMIATKKEDLLALTIVVPMLCLVVGSVVAVVFRGERLDRDKLTAIVLAAVAIWFASRSAFQSAKLPLK